MAAAKRSSPPTSFFNVLKAGALLPARNRSLFVAVFALAVAYTSLLLLVNDLAVQPHADKVLLDVKAFKNNGTAPTRRSPDELLQDFGNDAWNLARAGAGYLLLDATLGSAVWIVALFAAVATCSGGETLSFGALLRKARAQLKGPGLTVAFLYSLQIAYVAVLLAATAALLALGRLLVKSPKSNRLLLLGCLLLAAAATTFLVYFTFLCALGVVVAAAEPGRRGAGAVARAWRLLQGRKLRAVKVVAVVAALISGCSRVHAALARAPALHSPALRLLLWFLYAVAAAAVKLFAVCAFTTFYYECEGDDDAANTDFIVKLPSGERIGV